MGPEQLDPKEVLARIERATTDEERLAIELEALQQSDNRPREDDPVDPEFG